MQEVNITLPAVHLSALDSALRVALPTQMIGVSTYGADRPLSVWLDGSASQGDAQTAATLATAHDPVFLTVDKTNIAANGSDQAVVTVSAPKLGATAVNLVVAGTVVPITLTNGIGTLGVASADPTTITISVQNGTNRSTDVLTVTAS